MHLKFSAENSHSDDENCLFIHRPRVLGAARGDGSRPQPRPRSSPAARTRLQRRRKTHRRRPAGVAQPGHRQSPVVAQSPGPMSVRRPPSARAQRRSAPAPYPRPRHSPGPATTAASPHRPAGARSPAAGTETAHRAPPAAWSLPAGRSSAPGVDNERSIRQRSCSSGCATRGAPCPRAERSRTSGCPAGSGSDRCSAP